MCRTVSIYYSVVMLFLFLTTSAWAADDWCIEDPGHPPCDGAAGRCTRNADGSEGGFVAYSAYVESKRIWGWTTWFSAYQTFNIPKIGKYAQVCDGARVYGNAQVDDYAKVRDDAQVYGNGKVNDHAQVMACARVYGNGKVYGHAVVWGRVYEDGQVFGRSVVDRNGEVHGNAHISGRTRVVGDVDGEAHLVRDDVPTVIRKRVRAIEEESNIRKAICVSKFSKEIKDFENSSVLMQEIETWNQRKANLKNEIEEEEKKIKTKRKELENINEQIEELNNTGKTPCSICLSSLAGGQDTIIATECNHYFHQICFNKLSDEASCPYCRRPNVKESVLTVGADELR